MEKTPVTVLTGFLGAGKTTLLNAILSAPHGKKFAVIINEFGEAGIDEKLITAQVDEEIFETNNGCICCTVRGDLIRIIHILMKRKDKFDGILVETTGLANPAPVAQTFFADPDVRQRTELDSIITVVDAVNIRHQLVESTEAMEQIAFADTILINKTDVVSDEDILAVENEIKSINPLATLMKGSRGNVDVLALFGRKSFNLDAILAHDPTFLEGEHQHSHTAISSLSLTSDTPLSLDLFEEWMLGFLQEKGADILRVKGVLNMAGVGRRFVFQAVHMMSEGAFTKEWEEGEKRTSTLVLIGKDMDKPAIRAAFRACEVH